MKRLCCFIIVSVVCVSGLWFIGGETEASDQHNAADRAEAYAGLMYYFVKNFASGADVVVGVCVYQNGNPYSMAISQNPKKTA